MSLLDGMNWEMQYGTECYKNMKNSSPTLEKCKETIKQLNPNFGEDETEYRACILYLMNKISFWDDFPILYKLIQLDRKLYKNK